MYAQSVACQITWSNYLSNFLARKLYCGSISEKFDSPLIIAYPRAASFTTATGDCRLFDQDRHSMAGQPVFGPSAEDGVDYLEVSSQYLNRQDSRKIKVKAKARITQLYRIYRIKNS